MRLLLILLLLTGCATEGDPKTIARGAQGKVDYCITVLGSNLFCVNAKRRLTSDEVLED